ncbi:cellulose biosynthesis protein BcsP [Acidovorax kalamii]|uniref:cellulose biosynthesis protein BcsP n=1 Tax=Acidovorax kalamii TaxID=2004485 RepID=UPI00105679CD|nr:cellulose biosynthesis protein BcsP [Acidovorax kalamii]
MKQSDDIVNLFQQFGGKADPYQELARKQEHQRSSERWPLVSAVRGAVSGDVPAVDRRPGGLPAPASQNPAAPVASAPAPAGWTQPAAPRAGDSPAPLWGAAAAPQPAAAPAPLPVSATAMAQASAPLAPSASSPALAARSPLAGLAGLHASAAATLRDAPAAAPDPLPTDLPSVFARLTGEPSPRPATTWQPRKGQP